MEARRPSVRRARWHNLRLLKACRSRDEMAHLILDSLSPFARLVRVHDSGDFRKLSGDVAGAASALVLVARESGTMFVLVKK